MASEAFLVEAADILEGGYTPNRNVMRIASSLRLTVTGSPLGNGYDVDNIALATGLPMVPLETSWQISACDSSVSYRSIDTPRKEKSALSALKTGRYLYANIDNQGHLNALRIPERKKLLASLAFSEYCALREQGLVNDLAYACFLPPTYRKFDDRLGGRGETPVRWPLRRKEAGEVLVDMLERHDENTFYIIDESFDKAVDKLKNFAEERNEEDAEIALARARKLCTWLTQA